MVDRRAYMLEKRDVASAGPTWLRIGAGALIVVPAMLRIGWTPERPLMDERITLALQILSYLPYLGAMLWPAWRREGATGLVRMVRSSPGELLILLGGLLVGLFWWPALVIGAGLLALANLLRLYFVLLEQDLPPGVVFVGSFIALIAVGTIFLQLPAATPPDQPISVLDSVFTITSAISQTGLVVRPTGEGFTMFGQIVILIWIQVGALGVILFGAILALFIGAAFGLRATQTLADPTEQGWTGQLSLQKLVIFIIVVTHVVEAIGAALFYFGWPETWEGAPPMETVGDRIFQSVFFAVSGFCNAGFVTTENSMQGLRAHWTSHFTLAPLILIGSIGFPVLDDLRRLVVARLRRRRLERGILVRLNLNTKIVLVTTAGIYLLGGLLIFVGEVTQADQPTLLALLDAHFMVINRTSGFDTISPAEMGLLSQLALMLLMFIGGSPGSVAGGIKVMAFAVLILTIWSTILGRAQTQAFGRTIPDELVRKCATLVILSLGAVMTVAGVLAATETGGPDGHELDELLFEAVSAFGTTGWSLGITPELSPVGKSALIVGMFVGRVGPLAALAALVSIARERRVRYAYPTESVVIY